MGGRSEGARTRGRGRSDDFQWPTRQQTPREWALCPISPELAAGAGTRLSFLDCGAVGRTAGSWRKWRDWAVADKARQPVAVAEHRGSQLKDRLAERAQEYVQLKVKPVNLNQEGRSPPSFLWLQKRGTRISLPATH